MLRTASTCVVAIVWFVAIPSATLRAFRRGKRITARPLGWLAAVLFVVAWWLPSPAFLDRTTTFTRHAVGGGAACAVLALFLSINLGIRSPLVRIGFAYVVTATLGSLIEIGELISDERFGTRLTQDSAWDLLANAIGAITTALVLELALRARTAQQRAG